jgi:hypothetical protein
MNGLKWVRQHLELLFWVGGLLVLFFMPVGDGHVTICPLALSGMEWCPGCGLGRAIHFALHLDFHHSFHHHPLGIVAIPIIVHRVFILLKNHIFITQLKQKQSIT